MDPANTNLASFDGVNSYVQGTSVRSVKVTTWDAIYAKYSMLVAAGAFSHLSGSSYRTISNLAHSDSRARTQTLLGNLRN
jgi:hypothetical protein